MLISSPCCGAPHNSTLGCMKGHRAHPTVVLAFLGFVGSVASCTFIAPGTREAHENRFSANIGHSPSEVFKEVPKDQIQCLERGGEYGCLLVDRYDCRVWYVVDRKLDAITRWRYDGEPRTCWRTGPLLQ